MVNLSSFIKKNSDQYLISEIDDEIVIMNTDNGLYFGMNATSTVIWNNIKDEGVVVSDLIEQLLNQFEVEKEECENDTIQVLDKMQKIDLITAE